MVVIPSNFVRTIGAVREHVYGDRWDGPPVTYEEVLERRQKQTGRNAIAYIFGPNRGRSTCNGPGYMLHDVEPLVDEPHCSYRTKRVPESQLPIRTIEERLARMLGNYPADDDYEIVVVFIEAGVTLPYVVTEINDPEIEARCARILRERQHDEEFLQKFLTEYNVTRSAFLPPKWSSIVPTVPGDYRFRRAGHEGEVNRLQIVSFEGELQYLYYGRSVKHLWKYEFAPYIRDLDRDAASDQPL